MASATLPDKITDYLQDTHAMEQNVLRMLDGMISQTRDAEVMTRLRVPRHETERQIRLIRERLQALGSGTSIVADVPAIATAWMKGLFDMLRADKPGKMARDAYITEHVEIAAYSLLERLAVRAGDLETARLARDLGAEERQMADWIENHWDRFIDLTLCEDRIPDAWGRFTGPREPGSRRHDFGDTVRSAAGSLGTFTADHWISFLGLAAGVGVAGYLLYHVTEPAPAPHRPWHPNPYNDPRFAAPPQVPM
jgi:ferritin-like metal-binding protein YciE